MTDLRSRFEQSLDATRDEIALRTAIDDAAGDLHAISVRISCIIAGGHKPGVNTIAAVERVSSRLLQATQAWRLAECVFAGGNKVIDGETL